MAALTPSYGTLSTFDTLAASQQFVAAIGLDTAWTAIEEAMAAHNRIVQLLRGELVETTTDKQRRYGNPQQMKLVEVDQFGSADSQKVIAGQVVGFPLRIYEGALQWTERYFKMATGKEFAAQITAMMDADVQNTTLQIKKAIYGPTNYTDDDRNATPLNAILLNVKALANADGAGLPAGPNGEIFNGATHNHYLAVGTGGTLTTTDANALLNTVIEHFPSGEPRVYISRQDEPTWRALTGFVPYTDVRIVQPITAPYAPDVPLDVINIQNRAIGVYTGGGGGAEVWVKPWAVPGYAFAWVSGAPKPLCMRVDSDEDDALRIVADGSSHPLMAKQYQRLFGVGVWNRVNGAVLDMMHGTTYVAPSIT